MKILVINCGSSSVKYELFDMDSTLALTSGVLDRIGEHGARLAQRWLDAAGARRERVYEQAVADHFQAFELIWRAMRETGLLADMDELAAIGHRVVHGGETFTQPVLIDDDVLQGIRKVVPLAPLHNPANLAGIEIAMQIAPGVPQVAVFDTAFHCSIPDYAYRYALPERLYADYGVRRYGFHGTSHHYVAVSAAKLLGVPPAAVNLITLHLGNGSSAAAIRQGRCVDTSMGLTPLEGLVMGTRCGDIDPAIPFFLNRQAGMSFADIDDLLNRDSGLKGICGHNDMREVNERAMLGDTAAQRAIAMYCYRIRKYIGAYTAVLGRVDALVFTAGIGENAAFIRAQVCDGLDHLGIELDELKNEARTSGAREISTNHSAVRILVVPTNEEWEIARQARSLL